MITNKQTTHAKANAHTERAGKKISPVTDEVLEHAGPHRGKIVAGMLVASVLLLRRRRGRRHHAHHAHPARA